MLPELFVRADATVASGAGHVMRCIALAQAWKEKGGRVTFLSHCNSDNIGRRIQNEGFTFIPIIYPYPHSNDLAQLLEALTSSRRSHSIIPNWVVLDGYHFDTEYQQRIRQSGHKLLVIDDIAHLGGYDADVILNQNIHSRKLRYSCNSDTQILLGTRYALLRKEFSKYRKRKRSVSPQVQNILVTMGGSDPNNATLQAIEAIKLLGLPRLQVLVVSGPSNPHLQSLKSAIRESSCSMQFVEDPMNMAELMDWADIAVSLAGSTCWELAYMGLSAILVVLADHQNDVAEDFMAADAGLNLGWYGNLNCNRVVDALSYLLKDATIRQRMSDSGRAMVDGLGSERVLSCLKKK